MQIAVLMAAYNGAAYIRDQLASVLDQMDAESSIYIHDDGSSDGTVDIISEYVRRFPGRVVQIDGTPRRSAKANFWYLLSRVEADVYFFCDQDDVWLPDKIRRSIERLKAMDGECRCVFSDMKVTDEQLRVIDESFLHYNGRDPGELRYPRILIDNPAAGTTMCFDRRLRELAMAVDFDLSGVEMHDGFLLAMAALCGSVSYIAEPLVLYRQHSANDMGAAKAESRLQRVGRNLADLARGDFFKKKRAFLSLSRNAAGQLSRLPVVPDRERRILYRYAHLDRLPKWKRIWFMNKHGFDRARHTWWMYLLA